MSRFKICTSSARSIVASLAILLPSVSVHAGINGAELYQQHCAMCHGPGGQGLPGVFPPLAGADFLSKEREKAIRAPLEGLSGKIEVNGTAYHGAMPPVALNDEQLSAVFGHVFSAWGDQGKAPTREEIAALRAKTKFPTVEGLLAATGGGQVPAAPAGWELRVGVELTFSPVRLAAHPDGERVLILAENGDVWSSRLDGTGLSRLLESSDYLDPKLGRGSVMGLTVDREKRLYLTSNQRDETSSPVTNHVTIFRTTPWTGKAWGKPMPWFQTQYPWGVGPYNHGVSHIAQGPDGLLYVNSGSRTDGGEAGKLPNYATTGEHSITASLWRLNPAEEKPTLEIFAKGLRNSFGFCWDKDGNLLATDNGPDADSPEELNVVEHGRHYGFPFQFSDWEKKPYPHTPDLPSEITVTRPLRNVGPDAQGSPSQGYATFDPHSSPGGIAWLDADWPAPLGGSFLTARFGNLLHLDSDVGFDVLQLRPDLGTRTTTSRRVLSPLGRPIDLLKMPNHQLVIAEYCRGTTLAAGLGTPGRLLVLSPKSSSKQEAGAKRATSSQP